MATQNTVTVNEELADVHERLRQLVVGASHAEAYLGAGEHTLFASTMEEVDRLARVPFRPDVEEELSKLNRTEYPLRAVENETLTAPSAFQLMPAVYLRLRNAIVRRYLRQLTDKELIPSAGDARGIYPPSCWPKGASWGTFAELLVADLPWAEAAMREWRQAMEHLVRLLPSELSWVRSVTEVADSRKSHADPCWRKVAMEAMADAMDEGWVPESYPWDEQEHPRQVDPKKEPLLEYLRPRMPEGVGTRTIMATLHEDPELHRLIKLAGSDPDIDEEAEREIDTARKYIKDPKRRVA